MKVIVTTAPLSQWQNEEQPERKGQAAVLHPPERSAKVYRIDVKADVVQVTWTVG